MKGQSTITNLIYLAITLLIAMIIVYFFFSYLQKSSLETISSPFVITNFVLNNFQEESPGSCNFAITFQGNELLNLSKSDVEFAFSNGEYLYPSYSNYTETTSFVTDGEYLYYLNPKPGWSGYNQTICKFLSSSITTNDNYITGITRVINNKQRIFQRFTGNVQFLVNTPDTNPQDIYGDNVLGITATHNLGVITIKGITNSTFSSATTPGTYIYLPNGKYTISYSSAGSDAIFLQWQSDGGVLIKNPEYQITNMTVINNGQLIVKNTLSLIPPVTFNISENQTKTPVENKVNVTADYVSGYYTFYVNKIPYSSCIDTLNKSCVITENSSGTYNITASYKSSTIYGISNNIQETFYIPIYHFNISENQTRTLSGKSVDIVTNNKLENYTFYVNNIPYPGCVNIESKSCVITENSSGTYNISASYNSSTSDGISNILQETFYSYPFLYMSIQNTQPISTSSPFQQEIIFNADNYTQYESSNLGNIRILNSSNQQIDFWCQSGCYNTSTQTIIFMKIPNGINADSSKEYKLEFLNKTVNYNGTTAGEAPQLSPVYAEYDNGANVFNSYVNGDTPTSDFNNASGISISQVTNVDYGNRTINALYVSGLDNQNEPAIIYKKALPNQPTIIQSNFMHLSSEAGGLGASNGEGTLTNDISPSSSSSSISVEAGFGSSLFSQAYDISGTYKNDINQNGSDNSNWNYASLTYYGNSASSWYAYISPQLYSTAGGYSGTVDNNPLSSSSNLYMGVGLVSTSSNYEYQSYYNYILSITYPPNGVMPSVTFKSP